jgi:nucleotide-binding universal stress UspA family protein
MASHRRRSFLEMLLGSVTAKVLKNSKIPVLVYRQ